MMSQIVDAIQPLQSVTSHNSMITIDGEGAINYEVVQDYMESKIDVTYVENDSAEEHLITIISNIIITADMVGSSVKVKFMVHQSSS